jgi:hypothetical protein
MSRAIAFLVVLFVLGWSECGSVHAQGCRFLLDNCGGPPSQSNPNQNTQPARPNPSACPAGTIFRRDGDVRFSAKLRWCYSLQRG